MKLGPFLLVATLCTAAHAGDKPWIEVKSPNFIVTSNAGEKAARKIAWQLEQARATFQKLWPQARLQAGKPFVAFAAKDEATLRSLVPEYWERKGGVRPSGAFVSGRDRHYIAMRVDVGRPDQTNVNPYFTVYQGYVSIILATSLDYRLPPWLERGLMQLFGNTVVRDNDVLIGALIPWHFETLRQQARLRLSELLSVDRSSPYCRDAQRRVVFDAQSWALVHYLMFGESGSNSGRFSRFMELLAHRTDHQTALREAFGGLEAVENAVSVYITRNVFTYRKADLDVEVKAEGFALRQLSEAESKASQAALHIAMGRTAEAQALIDEVEKSDPSQPVAYEAEGLLLDAAGKAADAAASYARAVELGSTNFYAYYRGAALSWPSSPDKALMTRLRDGLKRSVELNGDFAWAQALLGEAQAALGDADPALTSVRHAIALEPGQPYHHLSAARVLWKLGRPADARQEADRGLALADAEDERQQAQKLIDFLQKGP